MSKDQFKVIIAGGSVAGLSLAKMLEKVGIDYIVLEAYSDISPQAGASIGLLPNGLRILDQIGCYKEIQRLVPRPVDKVIAVQGSDGQVLVEFDDMGTHAIERHGYPITFFDRQMLLQVLYGSIEDKFKVLLNKKVTNVEILESGVRAITKDGSSYKGDILIGADGIHSAVRGEMWRIANSIQPGYIPESEKTAMPCDYSCIFGISSLIPNLDIHGKMYRVWNKQYSYLVASGPPDRVYWFLFVNLGSTYYPPNIPRHTKQDEENLAKQHLNDKITNDVNFGDLYKATIISVMTALPEYVFQKWYFGRILTIGDAAHKFEPLSGQGGNAAIESAAALVNSLVEARKLHGSKLDDQAVKRMFEQVQEIRQSRVSKLVQGAHNQQRLEALENTPLKLIALHYVPLLNSEAPLSKLDNAVFPSVKLNMLPVPNQPRFLPYQDELISKPEKRSPLMSTLTAIYFLTLAYCGYVVLLESRPAAPQVFSDLNRNVTHGAILFPTGKSYTGLTFFDQQLATLVSRIIPAASYVDAFETLQCAYFLISLAPLIALWNIEGHRKRNSGTLLSLPLLWVACSQIWGIGAVAPWYFLASYNLSKDPVYFRQIRRAVPLVIARYCLPGIILGYLAPTALLFFKFRNFETHETWMALWQFAPLLPGLMAQLGPRVLGAISDKISKDKASLSVYENADLPYLKQLYFVLFLVSAASHIFTLIACAVMKVFSPTAAFLSLSVYGSGAIFRNSLSFFESNLTIYALSSLFWSIYSVWDIRRVGLSDISYFKSAASLVMLLFIAGPGGMISAASYWRETRMASISTRMPFDIDQKENS